MNYQAVEPKQSLLQPIKRFFSIPKLHVVQFLPKGNKPAITIWSFAKNEGKVMMEALNIEDKEQVEMFCNVKMGSGKLLKMLIFSLFER